MQHSVINGVRVHIVILSFCSIWDTMTYVISHFFKSLSPNIMLESHPFLIHSCQCAFVQAVCFMAWWPLVSSCVWNVLHMSFCFYRWSNVALFRLSLVLVTCFAFMHLTKLTHTHTLHSCIPNTINILDFYTPYFEHLVNSLIWFILLENFFFSYFDMMCLPFVVATSAVS